MKSSLPVLAVPFLVLALSGAAALADHCCGGAGAPPAKEGGSDSTTPAADPGKPIHGGSLTKKGVHRFETSIRADQVRVYVFDAKGAPLPVSKLRGKASYVTAGGEKKRITLKPVAPGKGETQAFLVGKHGFEFPAGAEAKLDVTVSRLGEGRDGSASFEVPLAVTAVVSYVCPMHAAQASEDPERCRKCEMALVRSEKQPKTVTAEAEQPAAYVCPMHPKVTSAKAGRCPECGMALRRTESAESAGYVCPMHPKVTSDEPGKCPDCGMKLAKASAAGGAGATKGGSGGCSGGG